jgi:thiol-disulfide isomerase/thioredoxin
MKFNQKWVYAGIFIVGAVLIYMWSSMGSSEGFQSEGAAQYKFTMYGVQWCPHCVKAKPEFQALGPKKTIGGKTFECVMIDPEENPAAVEGKKIEGYPTFHLYDQSGQLVKEYAGPRTTDGFLQFLESF